jgi:hypothetical protein
MIKTRWGVGLTGAVVLGVIGILGVSASGHVPFGLASLVFVQPESTPAWVTRIALVDQAIERTDRSRAIYEWREAYGAAVKSGRSEGLVTVADRAIRIAELNGGSGYFVAEADHVYVHAALRARSEGSRETILAIADRFEQLGNATRAEQMRRFAASASYANEALRTR